MACKSYLHILLILFLIILHFFLFVFASFYGHAGEKNLRNKLLPRIGISNEDSLDIFEKKLQGKMNWKGPIQKLRLKIANLKGERIKQYDIE